MMPAVSSKLRIAKDAPAPPKKIEKEDEEMNDAEEEEFIQLAQMLEASLDEDMGDDHEGNC